MTEPLGVVNWILVRKSKSPTVRVTRPVSLIKGHVDRLQIFFTQPLPYYEMGFVTLTKTYALSPPVGEGWGGGGATCNL